MAPGFRVALLFAASTLCRASEPAAGRWEGAVEIPGRDIQLVIDLAQDSGGQWIGSAILPGFGIKGAPLRDIAVNDSAVSFTIKGALGEPKLQGHLTANGTLTGEFQQAGNTAPLTLRNVGPAQVDLPRQSTPVPRELEGAWKGVMDLLGYPISVQLTLANRAGGKATAQFRIVGKRDSTVPLDLVIEESGNLTLESSETGITYEGRFRKETDEIIGTYRQGPYEAPLNLRPAGKNAGEARP